MAKRSDFAQKLLDDIRIRKQRMAAGNTAQSTSAIKEPMKKPYNYGGTSETTTNLTVGQKKRSLLSHSTEQKQFVEGNVSGDMVPFEERPRTRQRHLPDISALLAFAMENTRNLTSNGQSVEWELNACGNSFDTTKNNYYSAEASLPPRSYKLKQILKTYYKIGFNMNQSSINIGNELLKGAIDLEESLNMIMSLQEASKYMTNPKYKKKLTLIQDGEDDGQEEKQEEDALTTYNTAQLKPDCTQSIQEVISRDPWATRDWIKRERAPASSNVKTNSRNKGATNLRINIPLETGADNTSGAAPQGKRIPNVIAKLMGLDEFPLQADSRFNHSTDNFATGTKLGNPYSQRAQTHKIGESSDNMYPEENVVRPSQLSNSRSIMTKAPAIRPNQYPHKISPPLKENKNWFDSSKESRKNTQDQRRELENNMPSNPTKSESYNAAHEKRLKAEVVSKHHGDKTVQNRKENSSTVRTKQKEARHGPEYQHLEVFKGKHQVAQKNIKIKPKEDVNNNGLLLQKRSIKPTDKKIATMHRLDAKRTEKAQERTKQSQSSPAKHMTSQKAAAKEVETTYSTEQKFNQPPHMIEKENANHVPPVVLMNPATILLSSKSVEEKQVHSANKARTIEEADTERIQLNFAQEKQEDLSAKEEEIQGKQEANSIKGPDKETTVRKVFSENNEMCRLDPTQPTECLGVDGSMQPKTSSSDATLSPTASNITKEREPRPTQEKPNEDHAAANQVCQKKQAKESNDNSTNDSKCIPRLLWKATSTYCKSEYLLTDEETSLKQMLLASEKFLNTAEAHFKLQIPADILHATYQIEQIVGNKLLIESACEIMKRKGKREEMLFGVGLAIMAPNQLSKIKCLDDLIKQLHKDLKILACYKEYEGDAYDPARHLHRILKQDIENKDADVNTMWTFDWSSYTFACQEKDEVIRDVEMHLFNRLVDETSKELLQLGMSKKKRHIAARD